MAILFRCWSSLLSNPDLRFVFWICHVDGATHLIEYAPSVNGAPKAIASIRLFASLMDSYLLYIFLQLLQITFMYLKISLRLIYTNTNLITSLCWRIFTFIIMCATWYYLLLGLIWSKSQKGAFVFKLSLGIVKKINKNRKNVPLT